MQKYAELKGLNYTMRLSQILPHKQMVWIPLIVFSKSVKMKQF